MKKPRNLHLSLDDIKTILTRYTGRSNRSRYRLGFLLATNSDSVEDDVILI